MIPDEASDACTTRASREVEPTALTRRDMLLRAGAGFGAVALAWLLEGERARGGADASPLARSRRTCRPGPGA